MRAVNLAVLTAVLTAVVSVPVFAQGAKPDPKVVQRGQAVFAEQKCTMCHAVAGKGNKAGSLDTVGSRRSEEEIRQWLTMPDEMMQKAKPASTRKLIRHPKMSTEDLDAVVAYLRTLRK